MARALTGPAGWVAGRPQSEAGFVGMPLAGSGAVSAIGELLGSRGGSEEPVLVILPADLNPTVSLYVRFQLAHLRYPQRVDVVSTEGLGPWERRYGRVVTASGIQLAPPWIVEDSLAGFSAYVRQAP